MKTILDLLDKLGGVPTWVYVVFLILAILEIVYAFVKKSLMPIFYRAIKVRDDIRSINELRTRQLEIVAQSAAEDQKLAREIRELKDDMNMLHDKIDGIADALQNLSQKEEQEGMSRAQDRLLEIYMKYGLNNESGSWGRYESEVFFNTLNSYTAHSGNSFIVDQVVPVMKLLNVVDD